MGVIQCLMLDTVLVAFELWLRSLVSTVTPLSDLRPLPIGLNLSRVRMWASYRSGEFGTSEMKPTFQLSDAGRLDPRLKCLNCCDNGLYAWELAVTLPPTSYLDGCRGDASSEFDQTLLDANRRRHLIEHHSDDLFSRRALTEEAMTKESSYPYGSCDLETSQYCIAGSRIKVYRHEGKGLHSRTPVAWFKCSHTRRMTTLTGFPIRTSGPFFDSAAGWVSFIQPLLHHSRYLLFSFAVRNVCMWGLSRPSFCGGGGFSVLRFCGIRLLSIYAWCRWREYGFQISIILAPQRLQIHQSSFCPRENFGCSLVVYYSSPIGDFTLAV